MEGVVGKKGGIASTVTLALYVAAMNTIGMMKSMQRVVPLLNALRMVRLAEKIKVVFNAVIERTMTTEMPVVVLA